MISIKDKVRIVEKRKGTMVRYVVQIAVGFLPFFLGTFQERTYSNFEDALEKYDKVIEQLETKEEKTRYRVLEESEITLLRCKK